MHRIDSPGAVEVLPSTSESSQLTGFFSGGNPATGQMATIVSNDWLNSVQEELVNVIHEAGVKLDKKDNTQLLQALSVLFANNNPMLYPGAIIPLYRSEPLPKFQEANGAVIQAADTVTPLLWNAFDEDPELAELLKTEEEWQSIKTNDAIWRGNQGACGYFVRDTVTKTIRLPDLRGLAMVAAGFDGLTVGGVHGDMTRRIVGSFGEILYQSTFLSNNKPLDAFSWDENYVSSMLTSSALTTLGGTGDRIIFDSSAVVPTGPANWMRAVGFLFCVYTG